MNSFDFFNAIFCINLDKRTDRWDLVQKEFDRIGILDKVQRFSAVERRDGRLGVIKSHLECIKYAKKHDLNNILVFEDDVVFINDNVQDIVKKSTEQLPEEWDLLYLGANLHKSIPTYSPNLLKIDCGFAAHAITYNKSVFDKFIKKFNTLNNVMISDDILDVWLAREIQTLENSYLIKPLLATQRNSYSDIEKTNVNYSFIEERYNRFIR